MKLKVNLEIFKDILVGASIYSTGGGMEKNVQEKLFLENFQKHDIPDIISIDELNDGDYICCAYAVGSAANTDVDLGGFFKRGLDKLQDITGERFKAIFPAETNIEFLALQAGQKLGLHVLDADITGGRAVPEVQFDNFFITGQNIFPLVVSDQRGDIHLLENATCGKEAENFVRNICTSTKGPVAVFDHPISVRDSRNSLTLGVFERSMRLGKFIRENKTDDDLMHRVIEILEGEILIEGKITKNEVKDDPKEGFLEGTYFVEDIKGNELKIYVKNENLICWMNGNLKLTPPDFIISILTYDLIGLHNSKVENGQDITVIGKKASNLWRSEKGIEIFSPKSLGFDFESRLL